MASCSACNKPLYGQIVANQLEAERRQACQYVVSSTREEALDALQAQAKQYEVTRTYEINTKTGTTIELPPEVKVVQPEVAKRYNQGKPDLSYLPRIACEWECRVWEAGHKKYGERDGWKKLWGDKTIEVAGASLLRHALAIVNGEMEDPESGLPHAAHVRCNAAMLLEYYEKVQLPMKEKKSE